MKKLLVFLVMILGLIGIIGVVIALDPTPTEGITVLINGASGVIIAPTTVNFNAVVPGTNNAPASEPITFTAVIGSNENITIGVTSVTGAPFDNGLKFDGFNPTTKVFTLNCVLVSGLCTYAQNSTNPTLDVPTGFPAGVMNGIINYIITGVPPQ